MAGSLSEPIVPPATSPGRANLDSGGRRCRGLGYISAVESPCRSFVWESLFVCDVNHSISPASRVAAIFGRSIIAPTVPTFGSVLFEVFRAAVGSLLRYRIFLHVLQDQSLDSLRQQSLSHLRASGVATYDIARRSVAASSLNGEPSFAQPRSVIASGRLLSY
jgi:hypothetical protein